MKKMILLAVLLTVGLSYGQNYNFPVGLYNYDTYSESNANVNIASAFEVSSNNVLVKKGEFGVLVKYLGDCTNLSLFNDKGEKVEAKYDAKHKGMVILKKPANKEFYLEVSAADEKVFYHKVVL